MEGPDAKALEAFHAPLVVDAALTITPVEPPLPPAPTPLAPASSGSVPPQEGGFWSQSLREDYIQFIRTRKVCLSVYNWCRLWGGGAKGIKATPYM
jgi:hypothetical protein